MLAQLQRHPDVETAEVDRHGELLRVRLREDSALIEIRAELERMGFGADEAPAAVRDRWYGPAAVGELSREEAGVIATRVVPAFGAANAIARERVDAAVVLVADALYACFTGGPDLSSARGLASSCARAVERATRPHLGAERSAALARAVEADLAGGSSA